MFREVSIILEVLIILTLSVITVIILPIYIGYRRSTYKIASGNGFIKTVFNSGNYGEFLTFKEIEKLGYPNRLMTNIYISKEDGLTTEVDLIMVAETGIYVFESKNYSGWIYGDENQKYWRQTFKNRKKFKFFNPIWQNSGHISALKYALENDDDSFYKSYIIFSKRCTLKKIKLTSHNIKVIKRNKLVSCIKKDMLRSKKILSIDNITEIYNLLIKYCLVDDRIKQEHIDGIKLKYRRRQSFR